MEGAFNHLAIRLAPGAQPRAVIAELQPLLQRYGAREARTREHQASHAMLDNEIRKQRVLGTVLPSIFLGVAVFLLNVVVARLVATQREQIAALKALGYANRDVAGHYLKLVGAIVLAGCLLGLLLGDALGAWLLPSIDGVAALTGLVPMPLPVAASMLVLVALHVACTEAVKRRFFRARPARARAASSPGRPGQT